MGLIMSIHRGFVLRDSGHIRGVASSVGGRIWGSFYYQPEVSIMKYCCLGLFSKEYFKVVTKQSK